MSDPTMEDALHEIESIRRFAGMELNGDPIPGETTFMKYRRLLENQQLTAAMMNMIQTVRASRRLAMSGGTIIHVPGSMKNQTGS